MSSATLLWITFGSLALIIILLVIVMVARSLEKSSGAGTSASSGEAAKPGSPSPHRASSSKWTAASLNATLAALTTEAGDKTKAPEGNSTAKQIITGVAVVAGLIALVMGIIAGDG